MQGKGQAWVAYTREARLLSLRYGPFGDLLSSIRRTAWNLHFPKLGYRILHTPDICSRASYVGRRRDVA